MLLTKTYKVRKCSRNKLTKKQLSELRNHKFIVFERSYDNCLQRLNIVKAYCNTNRELHKYTFNRMEVLWEKLQQIYVKELKELNYIKTDSNIHDLTFNSKLRKIKISVEVF